MLNATTCYFPNAAKFISMGFSVVEPDTFGRRQYMDANALVAVDCAEGRSGEVTIWNKLRVGGVGRTFTGLLHSEEFFDQLLIAVGWQPQK